MVRDASKHYKTHKIAPCSKELSDPKCYWCAGWECKVYEEYSALDWHLVRHIKIISKAVDWD